MDKGDAAGSGPRPVEIAAAAAFAIAAMALGYVTIGLPPVVIVGESSIAGLVLWFRTYRAGSIEPHNLQPLDRTFANGTVVEQMRNYWLSATGRYYFPGLYTAILPMIPGIYGVHRLRRAAARHR